jgi:hypothetical protein
MKQALVNAVTLAYPDLNKRVIVMTDASAVGHSFCITQVDEKWIKSGTPIKDWPHQLLAVNANLFSGAQTRWSIAEKEIFAVVNAIDKSQDLLYSRHGVLFIVDSTTAAFYLAPSSHFDSLRASLRDKLFRYRERFSALEYDILVVPSISNTVSDYFSRYFGLSTPEQDTSKISLQEALVTYDITAHAHQKVSVVLLDSPSDDNFLWPTLEKVRQAQQQAVTPTIAKDLGITFDQQRKLWVKGKQVFIPDVDKLRERLLIIAHAGSAGHRSMMIAQNALLSHFYWDSLVLDLTTFVKACLHCLSSRDGTKVPRPLGRALKATQRNEVLCVDHVAMINGSNKAHPTWACILRDSLTGFVLIYPVFSTDAASTAECLLDWIGIFGSPTFIVSDKGSAMKSHVFSSLLRAHGVQHHIVNIDSHSGNAVERTIRTILSIFRKLLSELQLPDHEWSNYSTSVQRTLNNTPTPRLHGKAPIQVFIQLEQQDAIKSLMHTASEVESVSEQHLREIILAAANEEPEATDTTAIESQHMTNKKRRNIKAEPIHFTIGDFVLLSRKKGGPKLRPTWTGPHRVSDILTEYILELTDIRTQAVTQAHISRVIRFADASYEVTAPVLSQSIYYSTGNEVIKFLDIRQNVYTDEFELSTEWLGVEDPTWESAITMSQDAPTLVQKFIDQRKNNQLVKCMIKTLNFE